MNTMQIELSSPTHLKISWPLFSSEIDQEIRARLATVPGIEAGRGRVAWAPVIQLARLMLLFEKASYQHEAIREADAVARRFYDSLIRMGIELGFDEFETVCGVSDNVSPLLQQLICDRSHAIKPFVIDPPAKSADDIADAMNRHNGVSGWRPGEKYGEPEQPSIAHLYPKPKRRRAKKEKSA